MTAETNPSAAGLAWAQRLVRFNTVSRESNLPLIECIADHLRTLGVPLRLSHDDSRRKVLSRTTSGNVGINNTLLHYAQDDLPFGGVGPSGMGAYHGIEGFRALSHAKGIYASGRWNAASILRAPFGRLADRVLALLLR